MHEWHFKLVVAPVVLPKVPASHNLQFSSNVAAVASLQRPRVQLLQSLLRVSPLAPLYVPAGQLLHAGFLVISVVVDDVPYMPRGHAADLHVGCPS